MREVCLELKRILVNLMSENVFSYIIFVPYMLMLARSEMEIKKMQELLWPLVEVIDHYRGLIGMSADLVKPYQGIPSDF